MRNALIGCLGFGLALTQACGSDSKPGRGGAAAANHAGGEAGENASGGKGGSTGGRSTGGKGGSGGSGGRGGSAGQGATDAGGAGGEESGTAGAPPIGDSLLPSFGKGTRLQVEELRSGDMPPVFVTFHDSEHDLDCAFDTAADGVLRCLPRYNPTLPQVSHELFLDADCTERVAIGSPTCVPERDSFISESASVTDCETRTVTMLRATLLETGLDLYSTAGGTCAPQGQTNEIYRYFSVSEAAPELFVPGEIRIVTSPTRLSVERLVAEDGAFQTLALADPNVDRRCRAFGRGDGSLCVPAVQFSGRDYRAADDQCEVPLSLPTCEEPLYIADYDVESGEYQFFEAGPEHTGTVYGGVGTCEEVTDEGTFYGIGDPADVNAFAGVWSTRLGTGRLRHSALLDEGGTLLAVGASSGDQILSETGIFDTEFGSSCNVLRDTALDTYCIPETVTMEVYNTFYFADADCTQQVAICSTAGCPTDLALVQDHPPAACDGSPDFTSVVTLGDELELDVIYPYYGGREPGTECDAALPAADYGIIREISGTTDTSAFARLTRVTE
jgi:hypothetical protein